MTIKNKNSRENLTLTGFRTLLGFSRTYRHCKEERRSNLEKSDNNGLLRRLAMTMQVDGLLRAGALAMTMCVWRPRNDSQRIPSLRGGTTKQSRAKQQYWIASQARNDDAHCWIASG